MKNQQKRFKESSKAIFFSTMHWKMGTTIVKGIYARCAAKIIWGVTAKCASKFAFVDAAWETAWSASWSPSLLWWEETFSSWNRKATSRSFWINRKFPRYAKVRDKDTQKKRPWQAIRCSLRNWGCWHTWSCGVRKWRRSNFCASSLSSGKSCGPIDYWYWLYEERANIIKQ